MFKPKEVYKMHINVLELQNVVIDVISLVIYSNFKIKMSTLQLILKSDKPKFDLTDI